MIFVSIKSWYFCGGENIQGTKENMKYIRIIISIIVCIEMIEKSKLCLLIVELDLISFLRIHQLHLIHHVQMNRLLRLPDVP